MALSINCINENCSNRSIRSKGSNRIRSENHLEHLEPLKHLEPILPVSSYKSRFSNLSPVRLLDKR